MNAKCLFLSSLKIFSSGSFITFGDREINNQDYIYITGFLNQTFLMRNFFFFFWWVKLFLYQNAYIFSPTVKLISRSMKSLTKENVSLGRDWTYISFYLRESTPYNQTFLLFQPQRHIQQSKAELRTFWNLDLFVLTLKIYLCYLLSIPAEKYILP